MPIYSPTGFLDITNATLRTSNTECQNLQIGSGNVYVTTDLTSNLVLNLENITNLGATTSNTVVFSNAITGLTVSSNLVATGNITAGTFLGNGSGLTNIPPSAITGTLSQWSDGTNSDVYIASNVGIGNVHTLTSNTLQVGANLYVRDADANVLTVTGNVAAIYFEGDGSKLTGISSTLQAITDAGNVTSNTVQFTNATTGLITTSNVEIGGTLKINTISAAAYHSLQAVTDVGNVTSNTVQFTNATTGFTTTSNIVVGGTVKAVTFEGVNKVIYATAEKAVSTWTDRTIDASFWRSVTWSPELSLFVAVATTGTNRVATSPDGIAWTNRTIVASGWKSVTWSPELSLFVAVAFSGTNRVATSPDGVTWTGRTIAPNLWQSVTWSPELSLFVAVAFYKAATSPDGVTWTSRTINTGSQWQSVTWSPELTLFVAVANGGTPRAATSPDGVTWTDRVINTVSKWQSVTWSPELSLFVAVGDYGSVKCTTSPDGITWTDRVISTAHGWESVTWSPELSLFVAVASTGTNRVATSPDGVTWTNRTINTGSDWYGVAWSPELSLFVAVAGTGTNRVATSNLGIPTSLNTPMAHPGQLHVDTATGNVAVDTDTLFVDSVNNRVGVGTTTPNANLDVIGSTTVSNAVTIGTTKTFVVTVQQVSGANKYFIDGVDRPLLELHEHQTYLFDLTNSGTGHPFRLATVVDGGGAQDGSGSIPASDYTTGTDYTSVANHLKFTVPSGAPSTLYYYCTYHSGMGASLSISPTGELIVSGRVVTTANVEVGGELTVTGNLGIGTTSPGVLLDLKKDSTNGALIQFESSGGYKTSIGQKSSSTTDRSFQFTSYGSSAGDNPVYNFLALNPAENAYIKILTMTGNGNVGIGTTNPGQKLSIYTGNTAIAGLSIDRYSTGNYRTEFYQADTGLAIHVGNASDAPTEKMRIHHNGNVGIGTTDPLNILHLSSNNTSLDASGSATFDKYSLIIHNTRGSGSNGTELGLCFNHYDGSYPTSAKTPGAAITHERTDSWSKGKLHFKTKSGNTEAASCDTRMTIDESGNVGIGTTTPHRLLDVSDSTGETAMHISGMANQSNAFIYMTETSSRNYGAVLHYSGTGSLQGFRVGHLENSTTPRYDFAIDRTSGNVGIGITNPPARLYVKTTGSASFGTTWGSTDFVVSHGVGTGAPTKSLGVGIGVDGTGNTGTSAGSIWCMRPALSWNTLKIQANQIQLLGLASTTLNGGATVTSDDRLKTEETFLQDALPTIMKLKPQTYRKHPFLPNDPQKVLTENMTDMPSDLSQLETGLIVQDIWYDAPELRHLIKLGENANPSEVRPVDPDPSDPTQDPDYSSWGTTPTTLGYQGVFIVAVKAIQELNTDLQTEKEKNKQMEARILALENA